MSNEGFSEIDQAVGRYNEAVAPVMERMEAAKEEQKTILRDFLQEGKELRYKYLLAVDRELQAVKDKRTQLKSYEDSLRSRLGFLKQFPAV